ncbi:unnamed protein product [Rotaria sordida]|uniref:Mitochondrial 2-oxoglutarate/malate carrier protein n=1 Tax=Rotaria sordida TaxID=392033 RepID=A0A819K7F2_9BILA|nr:unnamed protein product [Rotaria sordida]
MEPISTPIHASGVPTPIKAIPISPANTPNSIKFLIGGTAGMTATLFVHPMEVVKNRMQMSGEGGGVREYKTTFHASRAIHRSGGLSGIYAGLSAGLFRTATYTTARLGIYQVLLERFRQPHGRPPRFFVNLLLGVASGGLGSFIGTPAEVALIRMTLDERLPMTERRNYAHIFNALVRITREEGVLKLWRGGVPTITRAMIANAAQMPTYSQAKQALTSTGLMQQGFPLHAVASLIAAFVTTAFSLPVDIIKTRYQNMKVIQGKPEYTGIFNIFQRILRQEGVFSFWKGFTPYFSRIGPHTILTFILIEQLNIQYQKPYISDILVEDFTATCSRTFAQTYTYLIRMSSTLSIFSGCRDPSYHHLVLLCQPYFTDNSISIAFYLNENSSMFTIII